MVLVIVSLLTYLNYDKILNFFTNKEWQIADSVGKIELESYLDTCGTSSNFLIIRNNSIEGYSEYAKRNFEKDIENKNVITSADGDYCVIAEKGSNGITVISGNDVVWNTNENHV